MTTGTSDPRNRPPVPDLPPEDFAGIPGSKPVLSHARTVRQLMPKKISHRLKYVAQLAAMGLTQTEICHRTGYTPSRLSIVLNSPQVSNEVELTRRHIFEHDAERALKTMLPKALTAIDAVLSHEAQDFNEKRHMATTGFTLIEHTHGKPTQRIEAGGALLSDLYKLMDERARADAGGAHGRASPPAQSVEAEVADVPLDAEEPYGIIDADFRPVEGARTVARPSAPFDPLDQLVQDFQNKEKV